MNRRNKSVASLSNTIGLFNYVHWNALSLRCTSEDRFEDGVLLNWVRIVERPRDYSAMLVGRECMYVPSFLPTVMIPSRHCVLLSFSMKDDETLRQNG